MDNITGWSRCLGIFAALMLVAPASAEALAFTVHSDGVAPHLAQIEAAISQQVATQVSVFWHATPVTWVSAGGIPVYIEPQRRAEHDCAGPASADGIPLACHSFAPTVAIWTADAQSIAWTIDLDHEILETEVDLTGDMPEICDPVEDQAYVFDNTTLSNWVLPNHHGWIQESRALQRRLISHPLIKPRVI